jgi:Tfp pilus assembly PilM family ATPase
VRSTLDYFRNATEEPSILSRVVLTGAGTRLGGLRELLEERLEVPWCPCPCSTGSASLVG